jgi:hypothetical protein
MKQKLKLNVDALEIESFQASEVPESRGTVQGHGPSAKCPTAFCSDLYGGYTCGDTCGSCGLICLD